MFTLRAVFDKVCGPKPRSLKFNHPRKRLMDIVYGRGIWMDLHSSTRSPVQLWHTLYSTPPRELTPAEVYSCSSILRANCCYAGCDLLLMSYVVAFPTLKLQCYFARKSARLTSIESRAGIYVDWRLVRCEQSRVTDLARGWPAAHLERTVSSNQSKAMYIKQPGIGSRVRSHNQEALIISP